MLEVDGVEFHYRREVTAAISRLSFNARPGITALVGVNGAGKTTLLKILASILTPSAGSVSLDSDPVHAADRSVIAPKIGYMPQDFVVPDQSRVRDVVTYLGWLKGQTVADARARAEVMLGVVGLSERLDTQVRRLSGGMLRRVALAQALIAEPQLLLLDEPTTGLDPQQRANVRDLLAQSFVRDRITILSSHVMEDVATLSDNVLLINHGRLIFEGRITDFCALPDGRTVSAEQAFLERIDSHDCRST